MNSRNYPEVVERARETAVKQNVQIIVFEKSTRFRRRYGYCVQKVFHAKCCKEKLLQLLVVLPNGHVAQ